MRQGSRDWQIRLAAFRFLEEQTQIHGELLPFRILSREFDFEGQRVPLLGPQGIFKPRVLERVPLSITTAPLVPGKERPYEDELGDGGLIRYRYRGTDPSHRDNVGLREAMRSRTPLLYLYGVVKGIYLPSWPVFVVNDDRRALSFTVQVDQQSVLNRPESAVFDDDAAARREYITVAAKRRLHQAAFRERVLSAYRESCAICRLKHRKLLDAAHIVPDFHPEGAPVVPNGLALCKLHHAAFDGNLLGIRPDLVIEISPRVLREHDGPMLLHGLQGFHRQPLRVPKHEELAPGARFLELRYGVFKNSA